jgi:hypothetical protein
MKAIPAVLVLLLLAGCLYDAPLTTEHRIAIEPAVLGLWEATGPDDTAPEARDRIMILKFSDTEYMIHYIATADARYYRGYPIEIGGVACVQLQVIGTPEGMPDKGTKPFIPVSYSLIDGQLEVRLPNTDLLDEDLKGSAALHQAFLAHKDDPHLFRDPVRFSRVEENTSDSQ